LRSRRSGTYDAGGDVLLAEITVGGEVYYCARGVYQGGRFYYPFITDLPQLEIGPTEGALIGVRLGDLVLTREPDNLLHPFGGARFAPLLNEPTLYNVRIRWQEGGAVLHDGAMALTKLDDESLTFALTDPVFEQELKFYSITADWYYCEEVADDGSGYVQLLVPNHEFIVGTRVLLEQMQTAGAELNYSRNDNNYYEIDGVNGDRVTIKDKDNVRVQVAGVTLGAVTFSAGNNRVGTPAFVPFTHGIVQNQRPVIQRWNEEIANPGLTWLDPSNPIEVWEDGTLIGSSDPASPEFFQRTPDETTIYLNQPTTNGDLSISGRGTFGTSLDDLFRYVANRLSLGYDNARL